MSLMVVSSKGADRERVRGGSRDPVARRAVENPDLSLESIFGMDIELRVVWSSNPCSDTGKDETERNPFVSASRIS